MLPFCSAASPAPLRPLPHPPSPWAPCLPGPDQLTDLPQPVTSQLSVSPPVRSHVCLYGTLVSLRLFLPHHHRLHLPGLCILSRLFFFFLGKRKHL